MRSGTVPQVTVPQVTVPQVTVPQVTVRLRAVTPVAFLAYLRVVAPDMVGAATATPQLVGP